LKKVDWFDELIDAIAHLSDVGGVYGVSMGALDRLPGQDAPDSIVILMTLD